MKKYVSEGLRRKEILLYLQKPYSQYAWSFRTLDGRLRTFGTYCTVKEVLLEQEEDTVRKELDSPGKLLGYRAMKINYVKNMIFLYHAVTFDLDEERLAARCQKEGQA